MGSQLLYCSASSQSHLAREGHAGAGRTVTAGSCCSMFNHSIYMCTTGEPDEGVLVWWWFTVLGRITGST